LDKVWFVINWDYWLGNFLLLWCFHPSLYHTCGSDLYVIIFNVLNVIFPLHIHYIIKFLVYMMSFLIIFLEYFKVDITITWFVISNELLYFTSDVYLLAISLNLLATFYYEISHFYFLGWKFHDIELEELQVVSLCFLKLSQQWLKIFMKMTYTFV
jgi:hypothetical protein